MTKPVSNRVCRSVSEASELLKLIGNANRLALVCYLMETEASVSALEEELGIRQPTLSQQLAELREAGIVEGRREGKAIVYRVTDARVQALVETLRELFAGLDDVTGRLTMHKLPVDEMMFD
ncbi:DNA-binding transcriptional regulator, ArsR family [Rhizobium sp. RU35A]|uniref:ArsR/SmtB family transcription factor n=1 Tax=Rhizobium sp. RU35A TaxID=1907414 RepID=UPI00095444D1|nr:metalloregulator ArsR/SmtB family transcription factor [Rhizobium sp. RU35A]SIR30935.1 DNA-binding transcriptional regulator, ArsR family [Rhizobium sp. RU35A]